MELRQTFNQMRELGPLGYSRDFWLLCLASLFFFASFNMVIPEFSVYLDQIGGQDYKKWIIPSFSLVALLSRPFSGVITDRVGRLPVMIFGAVVCVICGVGYLISLGIIFFFLIRAVHGLAAGFTPTGNVAYIADIVHAERRGEAMGWVGISGNIGTAIGPSLGGWISYSFGSPYTFGASVILALLSVGVFSTMKETLYPRERLSLQHFKIRIHDFWEPSVRRVSIVMALTIFSFGTVLTVIPDYTSHLGFNNRGIFFTVFVVSSLIPRLVAGKASDHFGREPVTRVGCIMLAMSMALLAFSQGSILFFSGAIIMGFAQGTLSPTLFAWASDLSPSNAKGRSMATLYIALELGVSLGAYISGTLYNNQIENLSYSFMLCALLAVFALIYLLIFKPEKYI